MASAYRHAPSGALVTALEPHADLAGQAELTNMLLESSAVYEQIAPADVPARVSSATGLPVLVRSCGPASGDKRLRGRARRSSVRLRDPVAGECAV